MSNLKSLREFWEEAYNLVDEYHLEDGSVLALLGRRKDPLVGSYACHCYFQIDGRWFITVGVEDKTLAVALSWFTEQIRYEIQQQKKAEYLT